MPTLFYRAAAILAGVLTLAPAALGQVNVLTQHNDNMRLGANRQETILTTKNVNPDEFGKLFARPLDGEAYAQPLYISALDVPGKGKLNVVFVATMHNSVYAFDADDPDANDPLWKVNLGPSVPVWDVQFISDISTEVGILSTPVIDLKSGTMWVLARTKENGKYIQLLHALNILTGAERVNSPVEINADNTQIPGTGNGSEGGVLKFDTRKHNQRPALALVNGYIIICWASHNDINPYHGWMVSYDATTLKRKGIFCSTPNGDMAGIWMSGQGPAVDDENNLYVMTGNGTFDANTGGSGYGESILKIKLGDDGSLTLKDWFAPYNTDLLNAWDADLGSAGVLVLPGTKSVVAGGKESVLYLLDRNNMGHFKADWDTQITQRFQAGNGHIHGTPIYWDGPQGKTIYVWSEYDYLKSFKFNGKTFEAAAPLSQGLVRVPDGMPGAFLSLSSDESKAGTGIVWANHPRDGNANNAVVGGIMRAYDASDLTKELWNSEMNAERDRLPTHAKFCPPTIANGRVYLPTFSNQLAVFGLFASLPPTGYNAGGGKAGYLKSDGGFIGGATIKAPAGTIIDTSAVVKPAAQEVYQTARMGDCQYIVTGLAKNVDCTVRLHFAHISTENPVSTVEMMVTLNNALVLDRFNVYREAGARNKAVIKTFAAKADKYGRITLLFRRRPAPGREALAVTGSLPIGSNRGVFINGIEVVRGKSN